jgi:predicted transcriptional regulator
MLLRKRAWDVMREEFPQIRESQTLGELIRVLAECQKGQPDCQAVVVLADNGTFKGVASIWNIMEALEENLIKVEGLRGESGDWDAALKNVCLGSCQMTVDRIMLKEVPRVKPSDPLVLVLETFLQNRRAYAAVEEGGKVIGMVYVLDLYKELGGEIATMFQRV